MKPLSKIPPPDPREQTLPKWAQQQLDDLRTAATEAQRRAEEARLATRPDDTDTVLDRYDATPIGLPKGSLVYFLVEGTEFHIEVRTLDNGEGIDIGSSWGALDIKPLSRNHLAVVLDKAPSRRRFKEREASA